jgi:hypothetical protein
MPVALVKNSSVVSREHLVWILWVRPGQSAWMVTALEVH